jgi:hypothetical protein
MRELNKALKVGKGGLAKGTYGLDKHFNRILLLAVQKM